MNKGKEAVDIEKLAEEIFDGPNNLEHAKKQLKETPALNGILAEKLFNLSYFNEIDDNFFEKLNFLLGLGVKLDGYDCRSLTLIRHAIISRSPKFVEICIEHELHNVFGPFDEWYQKGGPLEGRYKTTFEHDVAKKKTPLQFAIKQYMCGYGPAPKYREIIRLLLNASRLPFRKEELQNNVNQIYLEIYNDLKKALQSVKETGKKLMIMLGEDHEETGALLIEAIAIQIAKQLGIKNVYTEHDQEIHDYVVEHNGVVALRVGKWCASESIYQLSQSLNLNVIPVDLDHKTRDINQRNKTMSKTVNDKNESGVLIVGGGHLRGLLEDYPLDESYHCIVYDASYTNKQLKRICDSKNVDPDKKYLLTSDKIINMLDKIGVDSSFISPDYALELATEAHKHHMQAGNGAAADLIAASLPTQNTIEKRENQYEAGLGK